MSFNISLNLKPSVPLPDFANLTSAVNDINENMINSMTATINVTVSAFVNVLIVDFGIAAIIIDAVVALFAIASMLAYTIFVNDVNSPLAEATIMTMIKGMMK